MKKKLYSIIAFTLSLLLFILPTIHSFGDSINKNQISDSLNMAYDNMDFENYKEEVKEFKNEVHHNIEFEHNDKLIKIQKIEKINNKDKNNIVDYIIEEDGIVQHIQHNTKTGEITLDGTKVEVEIEIKDVQVQDYEGTDANEFNISNTREYDYINTHFIDIRINLTINAILTATLATIISVKLKLGYGLAFTAASAIKEIAGIWGNSNALFVIKDIYRHNSDHWKYMYYEHFYYDSNYQQYAHTIHRYK
ncbi:hypothetical protein CACET_c05920 [Clostridium aceticum]|uniref:Uncharacterized protein n=1 Tax=Clostridium aceticum TaxID=84022 RepID=A0A0D8IE30_9CLOT|nr:hypothetical protein [Clostridium aceticum]AKL94102.1 hypothetical protein CACET_c05920 [Clostridium aceticum]KJF28538.1 hypothetical protein TZ02_01055 [Clostridium aceticum]